MNSRPFLSNFFLLVGALFSLSLVSCSLVSSPDKGIKAKNITMNFKSSSWNKIDSDLADQAYRHAKTDSIILVNSLCQKYERTSLEQLTDNILAGLQNSKIETQHPGRLFNRASLRTSADAEIDGVKTYLLIEVVKKDRCIYDFVLITKSKESIKKLTADFNQLLANTTVGAN